jgi:hypothetical protein
MNSVLLALLLLVQGIAGQTGTVEGRVLNQDGTPAANIRVTAQPVAESAAAAAEAPVLSSIAQTDANGRYRLENVTPGRYYIGAGLVDFPTYYPGAVVLTEARVVTVSARSFLTGIDFTLAPPTAFKVSGRVIRTADAHVPAIQRVWLAGTGSARQVLISPDGTFEFLNVRRGGYTITVAPAIGSLPKEIVVQDKDVQLDLTMPVVVIVTGTLAIVNNAPGPRSLVLSFDDGANRTLASSLSTASYTLRLRPGNYRIMPAALPRGYTLKSITAGTKDLLNDDFIVAVGAAAQFVVTLEASSPRP